MDGILPAVTGKLEAVHIAHHVVAERDHAHAGQGDAARRDRAQGLVGQASGVPVAVRAGHPGERAFALRAVQVARHQYARPRLEIHLFDEVIVVFRRGLDVRVERRAFGHRPQRRRHQDRAPKDRRVGFPVLARGKGRHAKRGIGIARQIVAAIQWDFRLIEHAHAGLRFLRMEGGIRAQRHGGDAAFERHLDRTRGQFGLAGLHPTEGAFAGRVFRRLKRFAAKRHLGRGTLADPEPHGVRCRARQGHGPVLEFVRVQPDGSRRFNAHAQ